MTSIYTNGNANGNGGNGNGGNGKGNGHPLLITGHDIAALTNHDTDKLDKIAAQLVRGEAILIWPTVPQAAAVTVSTLHGVYDALRMSPKARALAAEIKGHIWQGIVSPDQFDAFVRANLVEVWDSVSRITA